MFYSIVTGNKGFVGSNLLKFFKKKEINILGVSRNPIKNEVSYVDLKKEIFQLLI